MNKPLIKTILFNFFVIAIFASLNFISNSFVNPSQVDATCVGDIRCRYTYDQTYCSGDTSRPCTTNSFCQDRNIGTCTYVRSTTDYIDHNCSAPGYDCNNNVPSCPSPYESYPGGGTCANATPPITTPPTTWTPPPTTTVTPTPNTTQYYGCLSGACSSTTWTSLSACQGAGATNCQAGSCPDCTPDSPLASYCLSPVSCVWQSITMDECLARQATGEIYGCSTSGCHTELCPPPPNRGNHFFYFFDDVNINGNWDHPSVVEKRLISGTSTDGGTYCTSYNTYTSAEQDSLGISPTSLVLNVDGGRTNYCGVGNNEWCDGGGSTSCFNDRATNASEGFYQCYERNGSACDDGYCGGDRDLKQGQIYMIRGEAGWRNASINIPSGWQLSIGTINSWFNDSRYTNLMQNSDGSISFSFYINANNINPQTCSGVEGIGLVRDYNKTCEIFANGQTGTVNITNEDNLFINSSGYSGAPMGEPSRLIMSKINPDNGYDTIPIDFTLPNTTYQQSPTTGLDFYIWNSGLTVPNFSFENGTTSGWQGNDVNYWSADLGAGNNYSGSRVLVANLNNDGAGAYDPYVVSDFIETGQALGGRTFRLKFAARSHNAQVSVNNIALQSWPNWSYQSIGSISLNWNWQTFEREVTFPAGLTDTQLRVVLRLPSQQVYYDVIEVDRSNTGYNCNTGYGNWCGDSIDLTDTLSAGTYKFFCDVPTTTSSYPQKCSGNPFCDYNGGPNACAGWDDCGSADSVTVNVTCANQCGGGCGDADLGTPNMSVWINSPSPSGITHDLTGDADRRVTVNWDDLVDLSENYDLRIFNRSILGSSPSQTGITNLTCSNSNVLCSNQRTNTIFNYDPRANSYSDSTIVGAVSGSAIGDQITVAVRGRNTTCGDEVSPWTYVHANLVGDIATRVYLLDPSIADGAGACTPANGTLANFNGRNQTYTAISSRYPNQSQSNSSSSFTIQNLRHVATSWLETYSLRLGLNNDPNDQSNTLVCAACSDTDGLSSCNPANGDSRYAPFSNTAEFYVRNFNLSNGPWLQWVNGLAFGGNAYTSNIPNVCDTNCSPYMSITNTGDANRAGIPLGGSTVSHGSDGGYAERSNTGEYAMYQNFSSVTPRNYAYYRNLINFENYTSYASNTISNFSTDFLGYGFTTVEDAQLFYRSGDLTINATDAGGAGDWNIPSGSKYVVFINGNLTINGRPGEDIINVADGGFLAFIVSGNITFSNNVGHVISDSSNPRAIADANVEGIFNANRIIIANDGNAGTTDNKFIGAGTFTGWDRVVLDRSFDDGALGRRFNNNSPTELFFYRPDFVLNTPRILQETTLLWQQSN